MRSRQNQERFFEMATRSGWFVGRDCDVDLTSWEALLTVDWDSPSGVVGLQLLRQFGGIHIPSVPLSDPETGEVEQGGCMKNSRKSAE